ncbi:DNA repair protein rhp41 [Xylariales sp. AK1849]|nr:DNA repair protein rhp41 [Xylariales sp. AK1849]
MAGRKRAAAGSARDAPSASASSRQTRASNGRNAVPDIYRQMLADPDVRPNVDPPERPLKRRKRPGEKPAGAPPPSPKPTSPPPAATSEVIEDEEEEDIKFEDVGIPVPTAQTMYRDSDEEGSDEDDGEGELHFEDVDFSFPSLDLNASENEEAPKDLQLNLSARANTTPQKALDRRKPINKLEKDRRVKIHKTHILCLLSHAAQRNRWCNDPVVQRTLRKLLNREMINYLNPGSDLTQFGQTNSLRTGLEKVQTMFNTHYEVTERGLRRALWADKEEHLRDYRIPEDAESPMDKSTFREVAKVLKGSRDIGAQLYCALLRSAGVEARLVCSLQPLSFASGGPSMIKPPKQKMTIEERYARRPQYDTSFDSPALKSSTPIRRRLGHPNAAAFEAPSISSPVTSRPVIETPKKIRECPFPVYWVEVLDVAHQKWQPVDPLVTLSIFKPKVFEPPANERENCLTYIVGFEADGTAKDVTRRYTKAYNAKTRKMRIESVAANGERWWRKALKAYSRGYKTDLDQIESNELTAAESREPMPRNVTDFKDHPIYALERHLRRHEVLVPGASASGTVGAGSKGPLEKIYRRKDVRIARTREKWYRMGREVAGDEIPVKYLPKPAKKEMDVFGDEEEGNEGDVAGTPIFTMEQTTLYKAPPIINGVIPKNRFGNLDIYVPSMVPEGGAYIADDLGGQAAFTMGIDYAPALTGFQFKGRRGTAVLHGVVVAAEHEEAVRAVIAGLQDLEADVERERRSREVLRTWKRFLMNLRIRQRIWAGVDEDGEEERGDDAMDVGEDEDVRGGEVEGDEDDEAQQSDDGEEFAGGFVVDDDDYRGRF